MASVLAATWFCQSCGRIISAGAFGKVRGLGLLISQVMAAWARLLRIFVRHHKRLRSLFCHFWLCLVYIGGPEFDVASTDKNVMEWGAAGAMGFGFLSILQSRGWLLGLVDL